MKTTIPYPIRVEIDPHNTTAPDGAERDKMRDAIARHIRAAAVDDGAAQPFRIDRCFKRGGFTHSHRHRWLPPIHPLMIFAVRPDENYRKRLVGMMIRQSSGWHFL